MNDKKRQALIKSLNDPKKFNSNFGTLSRLWFLVKVIRGLEAEGMSDSAVETEAHHIVTEAKKIVTANQDFPLKLVGAGNPRFTKRLLGDFLRHRVEILYGVIAFHRQFIEVANLDYLLFLAKRRLRTVMRMYTWVNPNINPGKRKGYWAYPEECPSNQQWRVNVDAQPSWEHITTDDIPLSIKSGIDPVVGINKVFAKLTDDACKGNLFDCAVTAEIMFVDSLLEAKNTAKFLPALPSEYLEINHMDNSAFATNPSSTQNPLERVPLPMPVRDLQVGDHCYIYNHPLYKTFRPTGSWTGEFAFVYICRDRNHRSQKGYIFGGHGMNGTLFQFYNRFVDELTTYITLARKLAGVHLAFMRGGTAAITPGSVNQTEDDIKVFDVIGDTFKPAERFQILEYTKTVEPRDFEKVPTKSKRKPKGKLPDFLVLQSKTENIFYLALRDSPNPKKPLSENLKKKASDLLPSKQLRRPIKFKRLSTPPSGASDAVVYAKDQWGVAFTDRASSSEKTWAFYEVVGGEVVRHELRNDKKEPNPQLFDSPFHQFNSAGTDIEVYLPRIDFGAHQTFLKTNEAF